jgi:hypothetical protein
MRVSIGNCDNNYQDDDSENNDIADDEGQTKVPVDKVTHPVHHWHSARASSGMGCIARGSSRVGKMKEYLIHASNKSSCHIAPNSDSNKESESADDEESDSAFSDWLILGTKEDTGTDADSNDFDVPDSDYIILDGQHTNKYRNYAEGGVSPFVPDTYWLHVCTVALLILANNNN